MNELNKKTKLKAILKIFFSILCEILVLFLISYKYEELGVFGMAMLLILWTIVCLIYFISGINTLKNDNKLLKEYLKKSNLTMKQLENEFKSAKKIGSIYIGNKHVFSNDSLGIIVVPIASISKLEIVHLGQNTAKMRNGYYYLYIYTSISEEKRKVYSVTDVNLKKAVEEIRKINCNVNNLT